MAHTQTTPVSRVRFSWELCDSETYVDFTLSLEKSLVSLRFNLHTHTVLKSKIAKDWGKQNLKELILFTRFNQKNIEIS